MEQIIYKKDRLRVLQSEDEAVIVSEDPTRNDKDNPMNEKTFNSEVIEIDGVNKNTQTSEIVNNYIREMETSVESTGTPVNDENLPTNSTSVVLTSNSNFAQYLTLNKILALFVLVFVFNY